MTPNQRISTVSRTRELIFPAIAVRRLHEQGFHALAGKLLDQQNLVSIFSAQPVGRVGDYNLDLSFGGEIAHAFQPRALQGGSASPDLRRPTLWAPPVRGSWRTRSATPSGLRSCSPRVAAPTKPGHRSQPFSSSNSFTRTPTGRSRQGT